MSGSDAYHCPSVASYDCETNSSQETSREDKKASTEPRRNFISSQSHYNLLDRRAELEVTPAAEAYGLGVLPYFPLASGLLTGKYSGGTAPEGSRLQVNSRVYTLEGANLDQLRAFGDFARERGLTEVQVAFSWLASRPTVPSVIAGATRPELVRENAASAGWVPTAEDAAALGEIFPAPQKVALF